MIHGPLVFQPPLRPLRADEATAKPRLILLVAGDRCHDYATHANFCSLLRQMKAALHENGQPDPGATVRTKL